MSIQQKILLSIIAVIVLMLLSLGSVFIFHISAVNQYRQVSDNLILEHDLQMEADKLTEAYNALVIAPESSERLLAYRMVRDNIVVIFKELDQAIENEDTRVAYSGLKSVILNMVGDGDKGLAALERGEATTALDLYNEIIYKRSFVHENTTSLLLTEISHLYSIQQTLEERYTIQLATVCLWIVLLVGLSILYAFVFAGRITAPIKELSLVSKEVAKGNHDFPISEKVLQRKDEVGTLAASFAVMVEKLNNEIHQVEEANEVVLETKRHLEERNIELERFNRMVVNREIRMRELKNIIATLEEKINDLQKGA
jgi:methyl-accepting chemotaxis protein